MARPSWFPDKAEVIATKLVEVAEGSPAPLQITPYMRALAAMLDEKPVTGVDPDMFEAFVGLYRLCFPTIPLLLTATDDEYRFYAGLATLLESQWRTLDDGIDRATAVLEGKHDLAHAVASMEVATVKAAVARTERRASDDAVAPEDKLLAELDECDHLDTGAFTIPLPVIAQPSKADATDRFMVTSTLASGLTSPKA